MQYPIPQFIESEGKIIFFLTFKQFFMLIGGGVFCALLFVILPFYFFVIGSMIIMGLVATVAFVKIDGFSIITVFLNFFGFTVASKNYTWKKKEAAYPFKIQKKQELGTIEQLAPLPKIQPSKLSDIKKMIETRK